ncbi:DUF805 domain-containing protein [Vibrio sp. St2]|uniref:DUF805 domain-containing protein n=1 Tax=Vibrio sp. St2 TaxID=2853441 RepID=UPI00248E2F1C|nr:DUF805 domain-containing protein [Vibrio sp. St2]
MYFYWLAWQRGLDFSGHSSRREFWMFVIVHMAVSMVLIAMDVGFSLPWLDVLYSVASFIPLVALIVRRMHDIGKSGLWGLVFFIPTIGPFWFTYLLIQQSSLPSNNGGRSL